MGLKKTNLGAGEESLEAVDRKDLYDHWYGRILREKGRPEYKAWIETGRKLRDLYECQSENTSAFNILESNTEVLLPALLGECPKPLVKKRFTERDAVGTAAGEVLQKTLRTLQDQNAGDVDEFEVLIQDAVLAALVPGRGATCWHYQAKISKASGDDEAGSELEINEGGEPKERIEWETVVGENIEFDRLIVPPARHWGKVPWIAYEFRMNREELRDNFGAGVAAKVELVADEDGRRSSSQSALAANVWQVWDKTHRQVVYLSDGYSEGLLRVDEDPLGLEGFFNIPRPLQLVKVLTPGRVVPLYEIYRKQAQELNAICERILKVTRMLRVRGAYDGKFHQLSNILDSEDGYMTPIDGFGELAQGRQGLDSALWLVPVEKLVVVLQQLYVQREQCKNTIYELTGISDILRGVSRASETLGAQQMKGQSSTVRLGRMQKEVARYARDCLRLVSEIAAKRFSQKTWALYSEVDLPTDAKKREILGKMQGQLQQLMAQAQQNPQVAQMVQQAQQQLQALAEMPSWEDVLKLLGADFTRQLRIDIETDSTLDISATEDKQNVGEFLNAMGQFLNGIMPLMEQGLLPFEAVKAMMLATVGKFRFSEDVEKELEKLQAPPPKEEKPDPAQQAKAQTEQIKAQGLQAKAQGEAQLMQMTLQMKQMDMQAKAQDAQLKQVEGQLKMAELQAKGQLLQQKAGVEQSKVGMEGAKAMGELEVAKQKHELELQKLEAGMIAAEHKAMLAEGGD